MKEIIKRLSLPTPRFFKKAQVIGGAIAAAGAAIIAMKPMFADSVILGAIYPIAKELIVAGTIIVSFSQLVVKPEVPNSELTKLNKKP